MFDLWRLKFSSVRHPRARRIFIIALLVLTVSTGAWFVKRNYDAVLWKQTLAKVPMVLAKVPLPAPGERPAVRFRAACALLAKEMDLPAETVEEELLALARETRELGFSHQEMEECGAALTLGYLAPDPFDPNAMRRRGGAAACLSRGFKVVCEEGIDTGSAGEVEWRALLIHQRAQGSPPRELAFTLSRLAMNLLEQNCVAEAETAERESLALRDSMAVAEDDEPAPLRSRFLACILRRQHKYAEEESLLRRIVAAGESEPPAGQRAESAARERIRQRGKTSPAYVAMLEAAAVKSGEEAQRDQDHALASWRGDLALCLHAQGKDVEAAALARKTIPVLAPKPGRQPPPVVHELQKMLESFEENAPVPPAGH